MSIYSEHIVGAIPIHLKTFLEHLDFLRTVLDTSKCVEFDRTVGKNQSIYLEQTEFDENTVDLVTVSQFFDSGFSSALYQ